MKPFLSQSAAGGNTQAPFCPARRRRGPKVFLFCWWTWWLRPGRSLARWAAEGQISPPASPSPLASRPSGPSGLKETQQIRQLSSSVKSHIYNPLSFSWRVWGWSLAPTDEAVWLVILSAHCDGAVLQHGHDSLEVALVDDASVVGTGLWAVGVKVLSAQTISHFSLSAFHSWHKYLSHFQKTEMLGSFFSFVF